MYQGRNYPVLFIEFKGMCIQHIKGQNCVHMYLLSVLLDKHQKMVQNRSVGGKELPQKILLHFFYKLRILLPPKRLSSVLRVMKYV